MSLNDYIKKQDFVNIPHVAKKFGIEPQQVTNELLKYSNWTFKDNLVIFEYDNEFPNWVEICDTKYVRGKTVPSDKLEMYCRYNQTEDQHISVFRHDNRWKRHYREAGNVRCNKGLISPTNIYLELDRDTIEESIMDALKIRANFPYPQFMTFWYSGNRSIHIEVDYRLFGWNIVTDIKETTGYGKLYYNLAHKIAGDIRHDNGINDPYFLTDQEVYHIYKFSYGKEPTTDIQKMRQALEVIDPNIYNKNSLIRQPYSYHEKGGKQKVEWSVKQMEQMVGLSDTQPNTEKVELKPYLLHWTFECYESKRKEYNYDLDVDDNVILKVYTDEFNFDIEEANEDGWINGLYSPFYEDTNPSVSININNGWYKDFGLPDHSFDLYTFYSKIKNIEYDEAKKQLR